MNTVYVADPARVGLTRRRMLALRAHGYRVYNAPRPLMAPRSAPQPSAMRIERGPAGIWIAIAKGDERHPVHTHWHRYMEADDAVIVELLASREEGMAAIKQALEDDGDNGEYFDAYVADNMLDEAAFAYGLPWLPEWQAA